MLKRLFPILFLIFAISCMSDIDKNITTDLQVEGNEIFNISFTLEESLFLGFQTIEDYRKADTLSLPGCPNIEINEPERRITLEFLKERDCANDQNLERVGKIHIQYLNTNSLEATTRLTYEDYQVRGIKVEGSRDFRQVRSLTNPNRRTEVFTDLLLIDQKESSTKISGSYEHQLTFLDGLLTGFSSTGGLEGRNITGRPIKMTPNTPRRYLVNCVKTGFYLPDSGSQTWQIFRNQTQSTTHKLEYELESECLNRANLTLQDGRIMVFRQ